VAGPLPAIHQAQPLICTLQVRGLRPRRIAMLILGPPLHSWFLSATHYPVLCGNVSCVDGPRLARDF